VDCLFTCVAILKCTNPSFRSSSESGYSAGIGDGGAVGMILYTYSGRGDGGAIFLLYFVCEYLVVQTTNNRLVRRCIVLRERVWWYRQVR